MRADQTTAADRTPPHGGGSGRAAVLGSPAGDSLAPALHRAAYAAMGLDWNYEAVDCDEPGLPALLGSLGGGWAGLCLGVPLERAVLPLLDEVTDLALDVGGADTVVFRQGRSFGEHTVAYGIAAGLRQAGVEAPGSAVVLGSGATACAALAALRGFGVREPVVVVRDRARATEVEAAAGRLGVSVELHQLEELDRLLRGAPVVVSTLPADAADALAPAVAHCGAAVLDAAYAAWPTRLAKAAGFAGSPVVDGLALLLHRTVRQIELLTGRGDVPVAPMRAAARAELLRRARAAEPAVSG